MKLRVHPVYMVKKRRPTQPDKAKKPKVKGPFGNHFLLEWREATIDPETGEEIGQQAVSDALKKQGIAYSYSMIGRMETGKKRYTQKLLDGLKPIYGADPAVMLSRPPNEKDALTEVLRAYSQITPEKRPNALAALRLFVDPPPLHDPPSKPQRPARRRGTIG